MKRCYRISIICIVFIMIFSLVGCTKGSSDNGKRDTKENTEAYNNKKMFLETFAILYASQPDVVITDDSTKYGEMGCGDCTYVKCDAYTTNGDQFLWHNLVIINSDGKMTWYIYDDDGGLATYRMKDNPHNLIDTANKEILNYGYSFTDLDNIEQSYKAWTCYDMNKYLPEKSMVLNYKSEEGDYSVYVEQPSGDSVGYIKTDSQENERRGTFRYEYNDWALIDSVDNRLDIKYIIPGGKGTDNADGTYVGAEQELFTVTTPAGRFEDCFATKFLKDTNDDSGNYIMKLYAPGIGLVLSLDIQTGHKYRVIEQLESIRDYDGTSNDEELDMLDQEQIEYEENGALSEEQIIQLLPGIYESEDGDELEIIDNGDGNYTINFSIYRLVNFENCGGVYNYYMINFNALAPNEDIVNGNIEIADSKDRIRLTITDSRWDLLETWTQIEFDRK